MSIQVNSKLFYSEDGAMLRLPEERDIRNDGIMTAHDYYLLLVCMCQYKTVMDENNLNYDKREVNSKILICKSMFEISLRTAMNHAGVDLVETLVETYDIKESKALSSMYNVIPGYMTDDGLPRVNLDEIKDGTIFQQIQQ